MLTNLSKPSDKISVTFYKPICKNIFILIDHYHPCFSDQPTFGGDVTVPFRNLSTSVMYLHFIDILCSVMELKLAFSIALTLFFTVSNFQQVKTASISRVMVSADVHGRITNILPVEQVCFCFFEKLEKNVNFPAFIGWSS